MRSIASLTLLAFRDWIFILDSVLVFMKRLWWCRSGR